MAESAVTEVAKNLTEAVASETTAKRTAIIVITNESGVTLHEPQWVMKHGHIAGDGLPPRELLGAKVSTSSTASHDIPPVKIKFIKARLSIYGCEGALVYRYASQGKNQFLGIKFTVPVAGQNKCTLALLTNYEKNQVIDGESFKHINPNKLKKKDAEKIYSKKGKWIQLCDSSRRLKFSCTMSGEDVAIIDVKIENT